MPVAHVTSTEAIAAFRASLIVYLSKARPVLEDACDEVSRTRQWLQFDRRPHWENQLRRRTRDLENAQQALYSARLANLRGHPCAPRRDSLGRPQTLGAVHGNRPSGTGYGDDTARCAPAPGGGRWSARQYWLGRVRS